MVILYVLTKTYVQDCSTLLLYVSFALVDDMYTSVDSSLSCPNDNNMVLPLFNFHFIRSLFVLKVPTSSIIFPFNVSISQRNSSNKIV